METEYFFDSAADLSKTYVFERSFSAVPQLHKDPVEQGFRDEIFPS